MNNCELCKVPHCPGAYISPETEEEIQQTIRFSKWYINVPFPEMRNIKNNNNHNKNNDKYNY
jgi:hypothetical protein